jgi:hypothetical protein
VPEAQKEHWDIFRAIRKRDAALVERLVRTHIDARREVSSSERARRDERSRELGQTSLTVRSRQVRTARNRAAVTRRCHQCPASPSAPAVANATDELDAAWIADRSAGDAVVARR